ncbi:hypothetical protein BG011_006095 [Mortierella polycephala]|uniref:WD40 repeat-like protein n=1 Tax=Mortierella polycephala TaxID=41804 RepID=A0A9P6U021_9FUNG|nr:hypothetical protein BG011_006095 [Mortierella polycephala]
MKREVKKHNASDSDADQALRDGIARAYLERGKMLNDLGYPKKAQISLRRAEKWGGPSFKVSVFSPDTKALHTSALSKGSQDGDIASVPANIFPEDVYPPCVEWKFPELDERLHDTPQLVSCLSLLQASPFPDDALEPAVRKWLQDTEKNGDERERLERLATDLICAFIRDDLKDEMTVAEVLCLAPVLKKDDFKFLLTHFVNIIEQSSLLNISSLGGLAQLIQSASSGYLDADDLVKILGYISTRLEETHEQSPDHIFQLTVTVSHVLDAMTDTKVTGLKRVELHEPLLAFLKKLQKNSDPHLVYQAAYAFQALQCVPDDESPWQATVRRTTKVMSGFSGLVCAVKGLDLNSFVQSLGNIQEGLDGAFQIIEMVASAYTDVSAPVTSGNDFWESLKEGFSFERKRPWYSALRGADTLLQGGELAKFRILVCEAPCRRDPAFQWGICLRLGNLAVNPLWDIDARRGAVLFLGEIYRDDAVWGQRTQTKKYILEILQQLSAPSGGSLQVATTLLQDLEQDGDATKQALYRRCQEEIPCKYPLKPDLQQLASPSLLDRVQNKPDVETDLRRLARLRLKERGDAVYIPPRAKANLQASDDSLFDLTDKVKGFLASENKVLLLLGESGVGKSTFNRELEYDLWKAYKKKDGRIPLFISLPAIDRPDKDLIAKQLRKAEFTESQIRELKVYREFVLICDGYDESQQTHNLYTSNNLNQHGEWKAQMVISCRSEYLGLDYRDRFQPGDRNQSTDPALLQEAVIAPFSTGQVKNYIEKYVAVKAPLWRIKDYQDVFDQIPSLQELVKNPFLLTLSLEVLPRMIDPGQNLSSAKITRVVLYDQFVAQWLERNKKRLSDKDLSQQEKKAFESLCDEGFTQNGMIFLKDLSAAIYEKQRGNPVVEYSKARDEGTWKEKFFGREDEKYLLREACPLSRNGNQFRFLHRSILEYGMSRAIYEPQERAVIEPDPEITMGRRRSVSSVFSFELEDAMNEMVDNIVQGPELNSPLVKRSFVREKSILQFLQERVQQEPIFKQQLLTFIESSKTDNKWRLAAANAITILVRAGVQFIGMDLKRIKIPGADLSHGVFDSAQLQGADLRKVQLRSTWLRQADLSTARMERVRFGELPFLQEDSPVHACTYSSDGRTFAVGLKNGEINLYDTAKWVKIHTLKGHTDMVNSVVYSPTGERIASSSLDATVRLWNAKTGQLDHTLDGHTGRIASVVYSPNGKQIVSGSSDKTVRLWDGQTGQLRHALDGHTSNVESVVYSPTGKQIASSNSDKEVRLWNAHTGQHLHTLIGHTDAVVSLVYSPNGEQIASSCRDNAMRLWDAQTGQLQTTLDGHTHDVVSVAYSPNGEQIASGSWDKTVRLWDVYTGQHLHTFDGHADSVLGLAYSPTRNQFASRGRDKTVRLWDAHTGQLHHVLGDHNAHISCAVYSPNGEQIASSSWDSTVRLWDAHTGQNLRTLNGHTDDVMSVAYSPDGESIVSGSMDTTARLWDAKTGKLLHTLSGHTDGVESVAFSPASKQVASGSWDMTLRLWDSETGSLSFILSGHTDWIKHGLFSPSGLQVASRSCDKTVRLWDTQTGQLCHTLDGFPDDDSVADVMAMEYSPTGHQIAAGIRASMVRLWDTQTGELQASMDSGHTDGIVSVAHSPNGEWIASGGLDGTARLWDVASGQCLAVIPGFCGCVTNVIWKVSPTGSFLATSSDDKSVRLWKVTQEGKQVDLCWSSAQSTFSVSGTSIQDVQGLSEVNGKLLQQRGAVGKPTPRLRGVSEKVIKLASGVARFKMPSELNS